MSNEKIKLLAMFFAKVDAEDNIGQLEYLREIWKEKYEELRIIKNFSIASVEANEAVIKYVINEK